MRIHDTAIYETATHEAAIQVRLALNPYETCRFLTIPVENAKKTCVNLIIGAKLRPVRLSREIAGSACPATQVRLALNPYETCRFLTIPAEITKNH